MQDWLNKALVIEESLSDEQPLVDEADASSEEQLGAAVEA